MNKRMLFRLTIVIWGTLFLPGIGVAIPPATLQKPPAQGEIVILRGDAERGDRFFSGESARIEGDLDGDLFYGGGSARISGEVTGDLVAGLQTLDVPGQVQGDIWVAGQTIRLGGRAGDDLRGAGQILDVDGSIEGNVLWFGQQVRLSERSRIGRNVRFSVQRAELLGQIGGRVTGTADEIVVAGAIDGDIDVTTRRLRVEETALVRGALRYRSPQDAVIATGARVLGPIERKGTETEEDSAATKGTPGRGESSALVLFLRILLFGGFLLLGMVWSILFPKALGETARALGHHSLLSGLAGLCALVVVPLIGLLLLLTVIGLPLGFLILMLYLPVLAVAPIPVALRIGERILSHAGPFRTPSYIAAFLVGAVLLRLLFMIPWVGVLLRLLVVVLGLGAIVVATLRGKGAGASNAVPGLS